MMQILIVGATGLIGSALAARLAAEGHRVLGLARHPPQSTRSNVTLLQFDLARALEPAHWHEVLDGIDAVVNCAGVLQDSPRDSTAQVHTAAPAALFRACAERRIARVIHFSAIGVDRETPTQFSRTKLSGDQALTALDLDWIILRPSVVMGQNVYGASALIRGLAALPILPVMPDTAPLQPVHLDDVLDTVVFFLRKDAPSRHTIELVGPRQLTFAQTVALFRAQLGWRPARTFPLPGWLARLIYRLGDAAALLGWKPPVRSTAEREMRRGAVGSSSRLTELSGITPRDLAASFAREPASVQERWFARLYLLKPAVFVVFSAFWIVTGLVSLGPGRERGVSLVMEGGISRTVALLLTLSGGMADIVIGLLIAFRRSTRFGLYAAFAISITYAVIGTILIPRLWVDPLGPMLKIAPVMVFNLMALAILEDR
jgi:uncharacterized protein YbjT (DUF2867 family)